MATEDAKKKTTKTTTKGTIKTAVKKPASTKKPTTRKPVVKKPTTASKTSPSKTKDPISKQTVTKKVASKKVASKKVPAKKPSSKKESVDPALKAAGIKKKDPKVLTSEKIIKQQAVQGAMEANQERKTYQKKGKVFYLVFSLVFYAVAFFYINNVLYDNADFIQSGLFAFAALFVVFLIIQLNIHMLFVNFFRLPLMYLLEEARLEIKKEVIVDKNKKGLSKKFAKYRAIFTLILYGLIILLLLGSQIYNGVMDGDKVLVIITQSALTGLVFVLIVCSWQYLFNIIPNILDKSLDAKNGFILMLSAIVIVIYIIFMVFKITYLAEMMIFILIIGFIALLAVNLNMIVGEINIFQNLRSKKSKTVTRVVFLIFFGFHLYVILYASVVAFSIYSWEPESFNFINTDYEEVMYEDVNDFNGDPITVVYNQAGDIISSVYDHDGNLITDFKDEDGYLIKEFYDIDGLRIWNYYPDTSGFNFISEVEKDDVIYFSNNFTYYDGSIVAYEVVELPHTYGDFLYYTVVTVSTLGYGDITPNSNYAMAQFWGGFLGVYGFSFFALSIGFVSNIAIEGATSREED